MAAQDEINLVNAQAHVTGCLLRPEYMVSVPQKKKKNSPRFDKNVLFLMLVVHFVKFNFGYGREPEKELYGMSDLNRAQERGKCL